MIYTYEEAKPYLRFFGRMLEDPVRGGLYINWSTAGIRVRFKGTKLAIRFEAIGNKNMMDPAAPMEYPWMAVIREDMAIHERILLTEEDAWVTALSGEYGVHELGIIKLTENFRGKVRLIAFECDGELLPMEDLEERPRIEFIGDSITCGYGNEEPDPTQHFKTETENGWDAYGPRAAREAGAEWSVIAVSGIAISRGMDPLPFMTEGFAMENQYRYTDRSVCELRDLPKAEWDFAARPNDVVVLNLGTNDATQIAFSRDMPAAEAFFRERYSAFIREIRRLNGPEPFIVCALGTLDYYLYEDIRDCVEAYRKETGDERISCFKFGHTNMMREGFGADMHPSMKTHERMGHELAAYLKTII